MIHNALVAIRKYHGISQSDLSIKLGTENIRIIGSNPIKK